jgi:hypothetical protein
LSERDICGVRRQIEVTTHVGDANCSASDNAGALFVAERYFRAQATTRAPNSFTGLQSAADQCDG